jgi:glycosyltransferase involved in cell wall biosynthesis
MRILFTNAGLRNRAGTELWVRDAAFALQRRSHQIAAYSTFLGEVADELRGHGITVVDRLEALPWQPEMIHGHHHVETMTAVLHLGTVPAVYVCHGVLPWQETPPRHPRLLRYAAVSELVRDTAVARHGVPPERISVLPNFVDLDQFPPRPPLPERPQRALLFSNHATPQHIYPEVLEACRAHGVELDAVGRGMGNPTDRPGQLLAQYDLVFAVGRAALEALACGAAVVMCGPDGLGPLVDATGFDRLRRLNFGLGAITSALTVGEVAARIAGYEAADAALVSARVREEAGLERAMDALEALYAAAAAEFAARPELARPPDPDTAEYITGLAHRVRRAHRQAARDSGARGKG